MFECIALINQKRVCPTNSYVYDFTSQCCHLKARIQTRKLSVSAHPFKPIGLFSSLYKFSTNRNFSAVPSDFPRKLTQRTTCIFPKASNFIYTQISVLRHLRGKFRKFPLIFLWRNSLILSFCYRSYLTPVVVSFSLDRSAKFWSNAIGTDWAVSLLDRITCEAIVRLDISSSSRGLFPRMFAQIF